MPTLGISDQFTLKNTAVKIVVKVWGNKKDIHVPECKLKYKCDLWLVIDSSKYTGKYTNFYSSIF